MYRFRERAWCLNVTRLIVLFNSIRISLMSTIPSRSLSYPLSNCSLSLKERGQDTFGSSCL